jgi:putative sporulation protein YyaC
LRGAEHIPRSGESVISPLVIDSRSHDASTEVALAVLSAAADMGGAKALSVVCVGTDRSTGDSLGPLVGTLLRASHFRGSVMGTLDHPVHAENLAALPIKALAAGCHVLGVDACLGDRSEIGCIMVRHGPLRPGLGVRKKLPPLGDLYIAGVVNVGGFMEYMVLQNTRLALVMKMAQVIASGILKADALLRRVSQGDTGAKETFSDLTLAAPETAALHSLLLEEYDLRR